MQPESPSYRQARRDSVAAATRRRRQANAHILQSSIQAKGIKAAKGQARIRHSFQRAEARRNAAAAAAARCARHDASHCDAFDHLHWLHSCTGSLNVMNARRLHHPKACGAFDASEVARQEVLAHIEERT